MQLHAKSSDGTPHGSRFFRASHLEVRDLYALLYYQPLAHRSHNPSPAP